ncbi:MAG: lactonase family protein [Oscillospiraceae bacterium]|nr:lactonase family protein [Oscillospiraceae bacterium]
MAEYKIFFGTYSKGPEGGVFSGVFNALTGEITLGKKTLDVENPSYLALDNNILYGTSEIGEFENENGGVLFAADITDINEMKLIAKKSTHGKHPCHLFTADNYIFVSNYSEGSLSIFKTEGAENIEPCAQSIYHFGGSAAVPGRQREPHIHFAALTPDKKFLAVCDLGMDKVFLYPYSLESGLSTNAKIITCPPGSGPRHLAFSKCGGYLYILNELSCTILVYEYKGLKLIQEIPALPADFTGKSTCAAIHVSPDGALLGASNRGHDSVAAYIITATGELAFTAHITTGKEPRDFRFSPDGNWLLTANQNEDSISVFKIENDQFTKTSSTTLPKPVCILFGEKI